MLWADPACNAKNPLCKAGVCFDLQSLLHGEAKRSAAGTGTTARFLWNASSVACNSWLATKSPYSHEYACLVHGCLGLCPAPMGIMFGNMEGQSRAGDPLVKSSRGRGSRGTPSPALRGLCSAWYAPPLALLRRSPQCASSPPSAALAPSPLASWAHAVHLRRCSTALLFALHCQ